jgi:Zn-dependent protease
MFGPVTPSPYDLRFGLLGIPVRVSPWFWAMAVILGWPTLELGAAVLLLWVLAVFVSIMVHEFGHALSARAFGYQPHVLLYQFGGLALFAPGRDYTLWRSLLITAAGPGAGLMLWLAARITAESLVRQKAHVPPEAWLFLSNLLYINLWWSVLNLLPVLPLDGGRIGQNLLLMVTPRQGVRFSLLLSIAVGGAVAAWALMNENFFMAIMFGSLAGGCLSELQQRR